MHIKAQLFSFYLFISVSVFVSVPSTVKDISTVAAFGGGLFQVCEIGHSRSSASPRALAQFTWDQSVGPVCVLYRCLTRKRGGYAVGQDPGLYGFPAIIPSNSKPHSVLFLTLVIALQNFLLPFRPTQTCMKTLGWCFRGSVSHDLTQSLRGPLYGRHIKTEGKILMSSNLGLLYGSVWTIFFS